MKRQLVINVIPGINVIPVMKQEELIKTRTVRDVSLKIPQHPCVKSE